MHKLGEAGGERNGAGGGSTPGLFSTSMAEGQTVGRSIFPAGKRAGKTDLSKPAFPHRRFFSALFTDDFGTHPLIGEEFEEHAVFNAPIDDHDLLNALFDGVDAAIQLRDHAAGHGAAQLTQRAGNFLVGRTPEADFKWENLIGKKVLGGRAGGMPQMVFEYILKKNGIDPTKDLSIDQSISFGLTAAAFTSNDSDYTVEFEPFATALEQEGNGYVVASLGKDSGYVPYTAYSAKKSYLEKHPEIIRKFTNAIQKGLDYVNTHSAEEIAETISPQFKETDTEKIAIIVDRYKEQDTWKENLVFGQDGFELLQDILKDAGELKERTPYAELVNTKFAQNAS